MSLINTNNFPTFEIEGPTLFSNSKIWNYLQNYYKDKNIDAWQNDEIPHYISSNTWMAKTYAEQILAFFRDISNLTSLKVDEPIYILELGAGSGRFSYHLLKILTELCANAPFNVPGFIYIISDFVDKNIDFWKNHDKLTRYVEKGLLDFAYFDAVKSNEIKLEISNKIIHKQSLKYPIIGIANYLLIACWI